MKHSEIPAPEKCLLCDNKSLTNHLTLKDYFLTQEEFSIYRCPSCGFMFTWPRPETEKLPDYYKSLEYISHSNKRSDFQSRLYQLVRNYTLKKKIKLIRRFTRGNQILDIGCATGEFLNQCKKQGYHTTGIEPDKNARESAIRNYGLSVKDTPHLSELPSSEFDVITMWHVLEHVEDFKQRMETVFRLLKPDGVAFVALPNPSSHDAKHYGKFWAAWDVPRHLSHFNRESMKLLSEKTGFEIQAILPMVFDSYYVSLLSEKYMRHSTCFIRAFYRGFISNFLAGTGKKEYSSLIYVLKKVQA